MKIGLGVVVLALGLAGCGSSAHSTETVTVTGASTTSTSSTAAAVTTTTSTSGPLPIMITRNWSGIKPSEIDFSGDAGNIVTGINWQSWADTGAVGEGASGIQSCVPNCAQGTTKQVPTTITLSDPQGGHFTRLVETRNGTSMTDSYSSQETWPLGAHS